VPSGKQGMRERRAQERERERGARRGGVSLEGSKSVVAAECGYMSGLDGGGSVGGRHCGDRGVG
jgi:hypothetical protein